MHPQTTIPFGFCQCGCGQRTSIAECNHRTRGYVAGQPRPFVKGHSAKRPAYLVEDRGHETPCWIWQRKKVGAGYGWVWHDGKGRLAHRVFYKRKYGPIPDGLELDHVVCQNPSCVNPDHVEPVTSAINMRRSRSAKLSEEDVREIRSLLGVISYRAIARRFDVSESLISLIASGKRWRD